MNENISLEKSFDFAVRIVNLYKYLSGEKREYVLSKQLLRSGTSIGGKCFGSTARTEQSGFFGKDVYSTERSE